MTVPERRIVGLALALAPFAYLALIQLTLAPLLVALGALTVGAITRKAAVRKVSHRAGTLPVRRVVDPATGQIYASRAEWEAAQGSP